MSQKAEGSNIIAPDLPVVRYSEEMALCYERLHQTISTGLQIPDSTDAILALVNQLRELYYQMREHLENDDGISSETVASNPSIEIGPTIKLLYSWETDSEVGCAEFKKREPQVRPKPAFAEPLDRFRNYQECWKNYRLWMFEADRALILASRRICQ